MTYLALKHLHIACVVLSGLGFFCRGLLMLTDSPRLHQRMWRILPHVIDTVLLVSAIGLVVWSAQYPLAQNWLSAKLFGLLLYIGFGVFALRRGKTKAQRLSFFIAALLAYGYIVSVAMARSPWGLLS